jgi:propionyl-CoA synthetase
VPSGFPEDAVTYRAGYEHSIEHPDAFWGEAVGLIDWDAAPQRVLDSSNAPFYRWFPDGVLTTCCNGLDRHADGGGGGQVALVYDSPVADTKRIPPSARCMTRLRRSRVRFPISGSRRATPSSSACR